MLYRKEYSKYRVSFEVSVDEDLVLSLVRLPKFNVDDQYDQQCYIYVKGFIKDQEDGMNADDMLEYFRCNAGRETRRYVVSEYTGREMSSENLHPDIALDGFLEEELDIALSTIDEDDELYKKILSLSMDNALLKQG